jgi:predicted transport protein
MANVDRSIVGELINFRGMVYAPQDERGVVLLFGKVADDLNMYIEEIRPEAPGAIVRRYTGSGWERVRVEFAYNSSQIRQRNAADNCDLIVCWEHDWADCPLDVVELQDRIKEMENWPIHRPEEPTDRGEVIELDEWFNEQRVTEGARDLFDALVDHVKSIDEACFYRVGNAVITFYSPQRAFVHVYPRQNVLRLVLFTRGEALGDVQPISRRGPGRKWGAYSVSDQNELLEAFPWVEESYRRLTVAAGRNEQTGWQPAPEEVAEEVEV